MESHVCISILWAQICNMRGLLIGVSVPPGTPQPASPKENHTEISISCKTDWPISSGYLLALIAYINPLFLSMLARWLGTFQSWAGYILLFGGLGRNAEGASCFPEYSCSHCPNSTSCLVDPPILPTWQISVYLKHD